MKKRKQRKSQIKDNTRIVVVTMSILFFLTIAGFYLFNWYINIDISTPKAEENYVATKTVRDSSRSKRRKQNHF